MQKESNFLKTWYSHKMYPLSPPWCAEAARVVRDCNLNHLFFFAFLVSCPRGFGISERQIKLCWDLHTSLWICLCVQISLSKGSQGEIYFLSFIRFSIHTNSIGKLWKHFDIEKSLTNFTIPQEICTLNRMIYGFKISWWCEWNSVKKWKVKWAIVKWMWGTHCNGDYALRTWMSFIQMVFPFSQTPPLY